MKALPDEGKELNLIHSYFPLQTNDYNQDFGTGHVYQIYSVQFYILKNPTKCTIS